MKKNSVPFHRHLISLLCVAVISAGIVHISMSRPTLLSSGESQTDELSKVHELYQTIQHDYYEEVDPDLLIEGALKGMTEALDDPYTTYLKEEESAELSEMLSGKFEGIGATLSIRESYPEIIEEPKENSPAAKSGLKKSDRILKIDGSETKDKELTEVVNQIRGEKGTVVVLTVQREDQVFDVEVTRDTIAVESLTYQIDNENPTIGSIEIFSFNGTTAEELRQAVIDLRQQGAEAFVLDVRQNPGGYLDQVERMASMFLEDGQTIVKFGLKDEITGETKASKDLDDGFKVTEPVVLIVDGQSASASEILAAALKESAEVPIVGLTTFGKGTVQGMNHLSDQSELKMTVQKWLTPSGEWLNGKGLKPTVEVPYPDYFDYPSLSASVGLKLGDDADSVSQLNEYLSILGYLKPKNTEAKFTNETKAALELFQQENQLNQSGEMDYDTAFTLEFRVFEEYSATDEMYLKAIELLKK